MATQQKPPLADSRTASQREADDAVATAVETGDWKGSSSTELCGREDAKRIGEHRLTLDPSEALRALTRHPFRWKNRVFEIRRCEVLKDRVELEVVPPDPEFTSELRKRIESNRF